jgi:hypothetical protein
LDIIVFAAAIFACVTGYKPNGRVWIDGEDLASSQVDLGLPVKFYLSRGFVDINGEFL